MTTTHKTLIAAGLLAMAFSAAAEAKVYRHTYYSPDQTGSVSLANPQLSPLMLKANQNSTAFKLAAKTRVAITISASCAIGTPGVITGGVKMFMKIQLDGQTLPEPAGHVLCHGDGTDELDNPDVASVTIAKTLPAGLHTLQLFANPQPVLGGGTTYLISGLSVVIMD